MSAFTPEPFSLYGIDRIVAAANAGGTTFSPSLRLTCLDHEGREVELSLAFTGKSEAYLRGIELAINDAGSDHGRLTHQEERVLDEEGRLSPRPAAFRQAAE